MNTCVEKSYNQIKMIYYHKIMNLEEKTDKKEIINQDMINKVVERKQWKIQ